MPETVKNGALRTDVADAAAGLVDREKGLRHALTQRQVAMIGLGATIGTGLFLGSAISVNLAGPAVILSFLGGALITLPVMWALAEMAAEHPAAGSFGLYAEMYLHPWAGFAVRYTYWLCVVVIVGTRGRRCVDLLQILVSAFAVRAVDWPLLRRACRSERGEHQEFRYVRILAGHGQGHDHRGFSDCRHPVSLWDFFSTRGFRQLYRLRRLCALWLERHRAGYCDGRVQLLGTRSRRGNGRRSGKPGSRRAAGAAAHPGSAGLLLHGRVGAGVGIVPWRQVGLGESPFVRAFQMAGIPAATHIMNAVALTAALSSALRNLYFSARLLFSLSRGGYAPKLFGTLSKQGMPVTSVLASSLGMAAALVLSNYFKETAFVFMIGIAFFGGPFVWLMILATHLGHAPQGQELHSLGAARAVEFAAWDRCASRRSPFHLVDS